MAFHPPMLYLGYVGFTVPFAFAIAALATGRLGEGWLVETRRATLLAWGFLTIGIILGAWWSYEVLGWGGYWGWDPVENASLLPWLTGTAYLHSVMVQERRGMLRVWNLSLLCATFSLTILGTFLTRSGVLESVHAFSDSDIGIWLLTFFGARRRRHPRPHRLARRSPPLAGPHRLAALPRRRVPRQQRALRRLRLRRAPRHRVPVARGGPPGPAGHGGPALLRSDDHADRHRPAVPDGRRARAAVAQGLHRAALAAARVAGVGGRAHAVHGRGARARAAGPRSSPSGWAGSPAARLSARWRWPLAGRAGGGSSVAPTAG